MSLPGRARDFLERSRAAKSEAGISLLAQVAEILRLRFAPSQLGMQEYYDFRVYRHRERSDRDRFIGWRRMWQFQEVFAAEGWGSESTDKLTYSSLCRAWGLPHPEVRAIYVPRNSRAAGDIPVLASLDEARAFLASPGARLPLFVKPIRSHVGLGNAGIAAYDAAADRVTLINGERATLEEVLLPNEGDRHYRLSGCLLQDLLRPHPEIARRTGGRLCTARLVVLLEREGPRVIHGFLKVARGRNMVDNSRHGTLGNSLGPVDLDTGVVLRQVLNPGFRETEVRVHPDTGEQIVGFALPDWSAARELCLRAAPCFGGFRMQGWDVALTDRGPMLVELNSGFDIAALQLLEHRGFRDAAIDRVLAELGGRP